jgi:2'-5' RNA ligase
MTTVVSHFELAAGQTWPRLMWYVSVDPIVHEAAIKWQQLLSDTYPDAFEPSPAKWLHVTVLSTLPSDGDPEFLLHTAHTSIGSISPFEVVPQPTWWPESLVTQVAHPTWHLIQSELAAAAGIECPSAFRPHMTVSYARAGCEVSMPDGPPLPSWTVRRVSLVSVTQRPEDGWYDWETLGHVDLS